MTTEVFDRIPKHLQGFIVDQHYELYTPIDHAVWRYVMRLNKAFLSNHAHESYIEGLGKTGIDTERIPRITEMNEILRQIGWAAVCVDGFIPPGAFMEFQAYQVLVIAADIRQSKHIDYTPAPDILHEAAGHAPIIADADYAAYLQLFGDIGSKAISSARDYALYEAIRHLSIVKENRESKRIQILEAEKKLEEIQSTMGPMSEMARLRNLHWWTVEYGLIGSLKNPKIYGAGLLSSIGESINCLKDDVKKLPYTLAAADQVFDITTQQPQLFVTPDFKHLTRVLDSFAYTMAFRTGGIDGLQKALDSKAVASMVFSSGLQVSGQLDEFLTDDRNEVAYLHCKGPVMLSENNKMLPGHGKEFHAHGYGSPVGKIKNHSTLPDASAIGHPVRLEYESGVVLNGILRKILLNQKGRPMLLTFDDCTVTFRNRELFKPGWGVFDLAIGESIVSVFSGPADPEGFQLIYDVPAESTPKPSYTAAQFRLHQLYNQIRQIREESLNLKAVENIFNELTHDFPNDFLLVLEIYELIISRGALPDFLSRVSEYIHQKQSKNAWTNRILSDGLNLIK